MPDVVLLERDRLTSGTTWHAAGLMATFGSTSQTSTELRMYTRDLYARLEAETGQATGLKQVGLIELAIEPGRLEEYRRVAAFNRLCGVEVHEISPGEVADAISAGAGRRRAGRFLHPGRRPGEPGRCDDVAGQRSPDAGRADHRGRPGHRIPASTRRRDRGAHPARRRRGRVRGQLRRDVGAGARRACRGEHPAAGRRALLPADRADRGGGQRLAGSGGPGELRLLPGGGRRADAGPVRAGLRAVEHRRRPR